MRRLLPALLLCPACIFGGGSPVEGTWKSEYRVEANAQDEFTLDETDGEVSRGTSKIWDTSSDVLTACKGEAKATHIEGSVYSLNLDPDGSGVCGQIVDLEGQCTLSEDERELDCTGPPPDLRPWGTFLRQQD